MRVRVLETTSDQVIQEELFENWPSPGNLNDKKGGGIQRSGECISNRANSSQRGDWHPGGTGTSILVRGDLLKDEMSRF